jgi:altronate dehydratase small subunit
MSKANILQLSPADNVGVVVATLKPGDTLVFDGRTFAVDKDLPFGHKVALRDIAAGEKIIKFGAPIGSATRAIAAGEHVHTHNIKSDYFPTFTFEKGKKFIEE